MPIARFRVRPIRGGAIMTWTTHLTDDAEAYAADGGEIVYAEGGDDQIYVIPTDDTWGTQWDFDYFDNTWVHGGAGDDLIVGQNRTLQIDILYGDSGNDTIRAGSGSDKSYGGSGDDIIWTGDGDADYVDAGADDDTVYATEATNGDEFHGGSGYDVLHLYHDLNESWNFSLIGGGSTSGLIADGFEELWFSGSAAAEVIEGGNNGDRMWGDGGGDILSGLGGDDWIWGENGDDLINGGGGDDQLDGGSGSDTINGGIGDDHMEGGIGNDFLYGGDDDDNLDGGSGEDSLRGDAGADILHGGADDDTLRDGDGNDTVYGDGGNDIIRTGAGSDEAWGGSGNDVIIEDTADPTNYFGALPVGTGDTLHGGAGDDAIKGGGGHDRLFGDSDDDSLDGGDGSDVIVGGLGLDVMRGGANADKFVWNSTAESGLAASEADRITDFNRSEGDRIDVSAIDANETIAGNQAFTFAGIGNNPAAGQIVYFTSATDTYILLGTDADTIQEMTIRLTGVYTVDATWFTL
jgi:Ca2+-binding RTX toxin-like protein